LSSVRTIRSASLAAIAGLALALAGTAEAAVVVDGVSATVAGPEAPAALPARKRAAAVAVSARSGESNLRRTATALSVTGADAFRPRKGRSA
jgi:hypothetical protein